MVFDTIDVESLIISHMYGGLDNVCICNYWIIIGSN